MFVIFIRTVILFILLNTVVRLMGKRHMGELEIGELVTTLMISEIATLPLQDPGIPFSFALFSVLTLMVLEIASSFILTNLPALKKLVTPGPSIIINKGVVDQKELKRLRISVDELMSVLRQSNVSDIKDVNYAIMEQNAKITVIPKASAAPPPARDTNATVEEVGIPHIIISNGRIDTLNMSRLCKDREWLRRILNENKCSSKEVFLLTVDDLDNINLIKADKNP